MEKTTSSLMDNFTNFWSSLTSQSKDYSTESDSVSHIQESDSRTYSTESNARTYTLDADSRTYSSESDVFFNMTNTDMNKQEMSTLSHNITSVYKTTTSRLLSTLFSGISEETSSVDDISHNPRGDTGVYTNGTDSLDSEFEYSTSSFTDSLSNSASSVTDQYEYPLFTGTLSTFVSSGTYVQNGVRTVADDSDIDVIVLKVLSLILIALAGIAGNGFILVRVVRAVNLHRPPFYYLLSMCVSDISRSVFCVPLVLTSVLQDSVWKYGTSACKLFAFANSFFIYSSCMSILAIAVDRHVSIVYSKYYRRRSRGLLNMIVVVIGWTVAFAMSFPPVIGVGTYVFIADEAQCTFYHRDYRRNDTLGFLLVFTMILCFAAFLYFRVFVFLRAHRRMRPLEHTAARSRNWTFIGPGANGQAVVNWLNGFGGRNQPNPIGNGARNPQIHPNFGRVVNLQVTKNEHLTRLFCFLTCAFGILWAPYIVLGFWRIFGDANLISSPYVTVSTWLSYTQVALCPVVYILSRGPIRRSSRTVVDANDKKEFLLEPRHRK